MTKKNNISTQTLELISILKKRREFHGISLDVTPESKEKWSEDYARFTIDIIDFDLIENPPEDANLEENEFWMDLEDWINSFYLEDDITVLIHRKTGEVQVYRDK